MISKIIFVIIYFVILVIVQKTKLSALKTQLKSDKSGFAKAWEILKFVVYPFIFPYVFFALGFIGGLADMIPAMTAFLPSWWFLYFLLFVLLLVTLIDRISFDIFAKKNVDITEAQKAIKKHETHEGKIEEFSVGLLVGFITARVTALSHLFFYFISVQTIIQIIASLLVLDLAGIALFIPSWVTMGTAFLFGPTSVVAALVIVFCVFLGKFIDPETQKWSFARWPIALTAWFQSWLGFAAMVLFGIFGSAVLQFVISFARIQHKQILMMSMYREIASKK
jgi:hypothetical protein